MLPFPDPSLWFHDPGFWSYLTAVLPLVAALLALPTLTEAQQGELVWPRPVLLEPRELWRRHRELALTEASLREGRWWTLLSSMFLHQDEAHLTGNVASLLASGPDVHRHVGSAGLYVVFFMTGAIAGANRWGRLRQLEAQLVGSCPRVPPSISAWMPERLRSAVDAGIAKVAKSSAPLLAEYAADIGAYIGASGGVCGVRGFSLGLALERLFDAAGAGLQQSATTDLSLQRSTSDLFAALLALDCAHFVAREWRLLTGQEGLTGVGHAGHLTGFAAGMGLLAALRLAQRLVAASQRPPDPPDSGPAWAWPNISSEAQRLGQRYVDSSGNLH